MKKLTINYESLVKTIAGMSKSAQRAFILESCLNEDLVLCQACVDAGFDLKTGDTYGQPFFVDYVKNPKATPHVVEWLVTNAGLDINYHSGNYITPLKAACIAGNKEMVKYLLDKNSNFDKIGGTSNYDGEIYWNLTSNNPTIEMLELLLDSGAPFNAEEQNQCNPLYIVIKNKLGIEFVKLFLQQGVPANLTVYGVPLLHLAVSNNDYDTAKLLLEKGADANTKLQTIEYIKCTGGSLTAVDIAKFNKNVNMQELLIEYGGKASSKKEKLGFLFKYKEDMQVISIIQRLIEE